ncbi:MAG: hypothetical protein WC484_04495 [Candidatus Omnitrophota bacterium]
MVRRKYEGSKALSRANTLYALMTYATWERVSRRLWPQTGSKIFAYTMQYLSVAVLSVILMGILPVYFTLFVVAAIALMVIEPLFYDIREPKKETFVKAKNTAVLRKSDSFSGPGFWARLQGIPAMQPLHKEILEIQTRLQRNEIDLEKAKELIWELVQKAPGIDGLMSSSDAEAIATITGRPLALGALGTRYRALFELLVKQASDYGVMWQGYEKRWRTSSLLELIDWTLAEIKANPKLSKSQTPIEQRIIDFKKYLQQAARSEIREDKAKAEEALRVTQKRYEEALRNGTPIDTGIRVNLEKAVDEVARTGSWERAAGVRKEYNRSEMRSSWQKSFLRPVTILVSAGLNMAISGFTFLYEFSKVNVEALGFDTAVAATAVIGIIAGIIAGFALYGIVLGSYFAVKSVMGAVKSALGRPLTPQNRRVWGTDAGTDQEKHRSEIRNSWEESLLRPIAIQASVWLGIFTVFYVAIYEFSKANVAALGSVTAFVATAVIGIIAGIMAGFALYGIVLGSYFAVKSVTRAVKSALGRPLTPQNRRVGGTDAGTDQVRRSEVRDLKQKLVARDSGLVEPKTSPEELVPGLAAQSAIRSGTRIYRRLALPVAIGLLALAVSSSEGRNSLDAPASQGNLLSVNAMKPYNIYRTVDLISGDNSSVNAVAVGPISNSERRNVLSSIVGFYAPMFVVFMVWVGFLVDSLIRGKKEKAEIEMLERSSGSSSAKGHRSEIRNSWEESLLRPIAIQASVWLGIFTVFYVAIYEFSKANVAALGSVTAFVATAVIGIIAGIMAGFALYGIVLGSYFAVKSVTRAVKSALGRPLTPQNRRVGGTDAGTDQVRRSEVRGGNLKAFVDKLLALSEETKGYPDRKVWIEEFSNTSFEDLQRESQGYFKDALKTGEEEDLGYDAVEKFFDDNKKAILDELKSRSEARSSLRTEESLKAPVRAEMRNSPVSIEEAVRTWTGWTEVPDEVNPIRSPKETYTIREKLLGDNVLRIYTGQEHKSFGIQLSKKTDLLRYGANALFDLRWYGFHKKWIWKGSVAMSDDKTPEVKLFFDDAGKVLYVIFPTAEDVADLRKLGVKDTSGVQVLTEEQFSSLRGTEKMIEGLPEAVRTTLKEKKFNPVDSAKALGMIAGLKADAHKAGALRLAGQLREIEITLLPRKTAKLADFEKDLGKQRSETRLFPGLTEHLEKVYKAWQIDEKNSEGKNITEKIKNLADRLYIAGMTIQHLAMGTKTEKPDLNGPKAPIRVREEKGSLTEISDRGNMVLTAVLTENELRGKGVFWRKDLENNPAKVAQYLNYAAKTHETWNSLDGGIGESVMREKWLLNRGLRARLSAILSNPQNAEAKYQPALAILRAAEEKGETDEIIAALREIERLAGFESLTVKMGAKATDLGRNEKIRGNEYFVQDAEVRLLLISDLAASSKFGKFTFQPFVNYQSRLSYEELMKRPCLWDIIEGRLNPRTYEQVLKDSGAEVLDPLDQKDLPKFEINPGETHGLPTLDSSVRAKGQPGGHGQWGVYYMINFTENTPPKDGFFHVLFFGNGDNRKGNPEPIVTGFLGVEKIPILKITTPATAIDKKGGKEGVRVIKNNGRVINVLEMFEEIDAKMAGQADLFYAAGQRNGFGQEGKQLFNTNLFYFNIDLLHSILTEMRNLVGQNDFLDAIMPTLFDKSEKATTIDGKKYVSMDAAIGYVVHNLNTFYSADPRLEELRKKYGPQILYFMVYDREIFAPKKASSDQYLQEATDYYSSFNEKIKNFTDAKLGLTPPGFNATDSVIKDGKKSDTKFWNESQHWLDSLGFSRVRKMISLTIEGRVTIRNAEYVGEVVIINKFGQTDRTKPAKRVMLSDGDYLNQLKSMGYWAGDHLLLENVRLNIAEDGSLSVLPIRAVHDESGAVRIRSTEASVATFADLAARGLNISGSPEIKFKDGGEISINPDEFNSSITIFIGSGFVVENPIRLHVRGRNNVRIDDGVHLAGVKGLTLDLTLEEGHWFHITKSAMANVLSTLRNNDVNAVFEMYKDLVSKKRLGEAYFIRRLTASLVTSPLEEATLFQNARKLKIMIDDFETQLRARTNRSEVRTKEEIKDLIGSASKNLTAPQLTYLNEQRLSPAYRAAEAEDWDTVLDHVNEAVKDLSSLSAGAGDYATRSLANAAQNDLKRVLPLIAKVRSEVRTEEAISRSEARGLQTVLVLKGAPHTFVEKIRDEFPKANVKGDLSVANARKIVAKEGSAVHAIVGEALGYDMGANALQFRIEGVAKLMKDLKTSGLKNVPLFFMADTVRPENAAALQKDTLSRINVTDAMSVFPRNEEGADSFLQGLREIDNSLRVRSEVRAGRLDSKSTKDLTSVRIELREDEQRLINRLYFKIIPWHKVQEVFNHVGGNAVAAHVVLSSIVERVTGVPARQQLVVDGKKYSAESILKGIFGPEVSFSLSAKAYEINPQDKVNEGGGAVVFSQQRFEQTKSDPRALFNLFKGGTALQGDKNEPVLIIAGKVDVDGLIRMLTNKNSGLTPSERNELKKMKISKLLKTIKPSQLNSFIAARRGGVVTLLADEKETEGLQGGMHVVFGKKFATGDEMLVTALAVLLKQKADQLVGASTEVRKALLESIPREFPGLESRRANVFSVEHIVRLAQQLINSKLIGKSA